MLNSSYAIFSIIKNVEKIIYKNKTVNDIESIYQYVPEEQFQRTSKYYLDNCKRIYNEVENCYYSHTDLVIAMAYVSMMTNKRIVLYSLKSKNIINIKKIFSNDQLKRDKQFIIDINKSLKLKSINDFIDIGDDGLSIVYHLTRDKHISPLFYLYLIKKGLTVKKENVILKEYENFETCINLIDKVLFENHKEV